MLEPTHSPPPPLPSNRKFGFFFAAIFAAFAAFALWKGHALRAEIFAGLSALFLLPSLLAPKILAPLNRLWMAFGMLLGKIVSPLVLGFLFLVLVTPVALMTQLIGRDPLRMKKRSASSYWIERDPMGPEPTSFKNQY